MDKDSGSEQSVIFDKSIGLMNLDKVAALMEAQYDIPKKELEEATQVHFVKKFPEFRKYFPRDLSLIYNYSSEMRVDQYNCYDIISVKDDKARWRPSI
ncbi:MAG: hypothetical protein V4489_01940 [Chlamydiota bacterium]